MSSEQHSASDHDLLIRISTQVEILSVAMTTRAGFVDTRMNELEVRTTSLEKVSWMLGGGVAMLGLVGFGVILRLLGVLP